MGIFGGPKTTQTSNNTQQQNQTQLSSNTSATQTQQNQNGATSATGQSTSTSTPNLPSWYSSFLSSIPGQYQSLAKTLGAQATQPLIGAPQQANYIQGVNEQTAGANKNLASILAAHGALNSSRYGQGVTSLQQGAAQQIGNYQAQVPIQNANYQAQMLQQLQSAINGQAGFTSPISAFGTTSTGNTAQTGTTANTSTGNSNTNSVMQSLLNSLTQSQGTQTSQTNPNIIGSILSGLIGAGLGMI